MTDPEAVIRHHQGKGREVYSLDDLNLDPWSGS